MNIAFGLKEFLFLLTGLKWTIFLSLIAFTGGGAAGLLVAVARTAQNAALRRAMMLYIAVFQGTPLLMQLFVVYYGLGLIGIQLPAWAAVAIAFTLNASAFLGDIWRGAIEALPRASVQDTQITKNAPDGTTIRRFDDDAATIQALLSGQVDAVGGNMFYLDRIGATKPGVFETKLEFTRLFNGACTRLGDKELNTAANSFVDQIKTNGLLAHAYTTWMKQEPPASFPDAIDGVPFIAA